MIGEIIAIGNELTSGRILNTTSHFAAGHLFSAGHELLAMSTVGDTPEEIGKALKQAISRAEFVVVTGGLGATSDDLTNEAVANALDRPTRLYPEILEKLKLHSRKDSSKKCESLEKLAWLPEGAKILNPDSRMAGYFLVHDDIPVFFLPGVPHEMEELLAERVIPILSKGSRVSARYVWQKVYKVFGLTEIEINQALCDLEESDSRISIGYYPVYPDVHVSLTVVDDNFKDTEDFYRKTSAKIEALLGEFIYGSDADTMESVVGKLLKEKNKTLAVAESCSGGLIAHKITTVPGSSDYFLGGVVAYSNDLKEQFLGVERETLAQHGAVSGQTARAMAEGIRETTGADIAVSVTGIAGPSGGSDEKPVGTVYFGLAAEDKSFDFCHLFSGERWQVQEKTAQKALDYIRRKLLDKKLEEN